MLKKGEKVCILINGISDEYENIYLETSYTSRQKKFEKASSIRLQQSLQISDSSYLYSTLAIHLVESVTLNSEIALNSEVENWKLSAAESCSNPQKNGSGGICRASTPASSISMTSAIVGRS